MEIRFSKFEAPFAEKVVIAEVSKTKPTTYARVASARDGRVRFSLREYRRAPFKDCIASEADHDRVIRALLTLDPDATIRTARAVYEGLEDFEKQRGLK